MAFFSYEYFCGSNIVVELQGMPLLECAGISYDVRESRQPIYGYSSRFFDATASGRVIVQGSFIVNYVHNDYVFRAIEMGINEVNSSGGAGINIRGSTEEEVLGFLGAVDSVQQQEDAQAAADIFIADYPQNKIAGEGLKARSWGSLFGLSTDFADTTYNPHDNAFPIDIKITFGDRNVSNGYSGDTGLVISSAYILGRGVPIRIDEEVIVEEYPFFARNIYTLKPSNGFVMNGDEITTVPNN